MVFSRTNRHFFSLFFFFFLRATALDEIKALIAAGRAAKIKWQLRRIGQRNVPPSLFLSPFLVPFSVLSPCARPSVRRHLVSPFFGFFPPRCETHAERHRFVVVRERRRETKRRKMKKKKEKERKKREGNAKNRLSKTKYNRGSTAQLD